MWLIIFFFFRNGKTLSLFFFFSSRRRHTRFSRDWSSDVCSSDLARRLRSDPGELLGLGSAVISEGLVEWYAGELDSAEQILRQGWDELVRRSGERGRLSVVA